MSEPSKVPSSADLEAMAREAEIAAATSIVPGARVQLRQHDYLPAESKADPPQASGPVDLWAYAEVRDVLPSGQVRVTVNHPGNRQHGRLVTAARADLRTAADVEALAGAVNTGNANYDRALRGHYQAQLARLKGKA